MTTTNSIVHAQLLAGYTGVSEKGVIVGVTRTYGSKPQRFAGLTGIEADKLIETAMDKLNEFIESQIAAGVSQINVLVSTNIALYARQACIKAHGKDNKEYDQVKFTNWLLGSYQKRDKDGNKTAERLPSPETDTQTVRLFNTIKNVINVNVNIEDVMTLWRYQVDTKAANMPSVVRPVKAQKGYSLLGKTEDNKYYPIPEATVYAGYMPDYDTPLRQVGKKFYVERLVVIGGQPQLTSSIDNLLKSNPGFKDQLAGVSATMSVLVNDLVIFNAIKSRVEKAPEAILSADDLDGLADF